LDATGLNDPSVIYFVAIGGGAKSPVLLSAM
jgi:hypothetical protein